MLALSFRFQKYRIEVWLVIAGVVIATAFSFVQWQFLTSEQFTPLHGSIPNNTAFVHLLGVPLDDVYIHCRYANNLLHGYSYCFNPNQTLTADTSPLWVLLIAFGGLFTSHLELVAIGLSVLSYLIIGPGIYRTARDVFSFSEYNARLAGVIAVLCSRLAWSAMSGMETALAALLMLLAVEEHVRSRKQGCLRAREAVWLGLALLLRPEFLFVTIVLAIDWIYSAVKKRANIKAIRLVVLLFFTLSSPAFLLPLVTRNSLIFYSSVVQGAGISWVPNFGYLWFSLKIIASNNFILFLLLLIGLWTLKKESHYRILFIIALGLPILQAFVAPQFRHHGRYFFPIFPLVIILGIGTWNRIKQVGRFGPMIILLVLLAALIETGRWSIIEAESVRNINDQHLAIVNWLHANLKPTDTLAVDDIGAIGYYLDRPVIDLTGLATPALWQIEYNQDSVWKATRAMGANIFVIYNRLNPSLYEHHKGSLELVRAFPVRLPLASAADTTMSVYRTRSNGS
jgi:hypothetical protein